MVVPVVQLVVDSISLSFGRSQTLARVSTTVHQGEILAIIGPNGAGKTSLLNCINGFYKPQQGRILYQGHDLTRLPSFRIPQLGIARTFQNLALYTGLSTLDNLMAARHIHTHAGLLQCLLYWGLAHREDIAHRRVVEEIIDFLEIEHHRKTVVGALPHGLRKRVELGRALALEPSLLLLDEPMTGMNQEEKEDMARFILDVRAEWGVTVLMVEHDMGLVMDLSDHVVVLNFGEVIAQGAPAEVQRNPEVVRAYLGSGDVSALRQRFHGTAAGEKAA